MCYVTKVLKVQWQKLLKICHCNILSHERMLHYYRKGSTFGFITTGLCNHPCVFLAAHIADWPGNIHHVPQCEAPDCFLHIYQYLAGLNTRVVDQNVNTYSDRAQSYETWKGCTAWTLDVFSSHLDDSNHCYWLWKLFFLAVSWLEHNFELYPSVSGFSAQLHHAYRNVCPTRVRCYKLF